jgi:hypothetical protein
VNATSYSVQVKKSSVPNYQDYTSPAQTITITPAGQSPFTFAQVSSQVYNPDNKNIPLVSYLSGGTSGGTYSLIVDLVAVTGTTLTYVNATSYSVSVKSVVPNYTDYTSATQSITITPAEQTPFTFNQVSSQSYNSANKNISILPDLSGGTPGGTYSLIVDSIEVTGTTFTYTDARSYSVAVKSVVPNYTDYTSPSQTITITQAEQTPFTFNQVSSQSYNSANKNISILPYLSGGTPGGTYSLIVDSIEVTGTTLTYVNAGSYSVRVKSVVPDYADYTSAVQTIIITSETQSPFIFSQPSSQIYNPDDMTVSILPYLSGGTTGGTYSLIVDSEEVTGTIFTYVNIGDYSVRVKSIVPNYADYTSDPQTVTITAATQTEFIFNQVSSQVYNASYKNVSLSTYLSGGTTGGTYNLIVDSVEVPGTIFTYVDAGSYSVAVKSIVPNYTNYTCPPQTIIVDAEEQTPFAFSLPSSIVYNPDKTVSILPYLSGGTTGGTYSLIVNSVAVVGTDITYNNVTSILVAVKSTVPNFTDYTCPAQTITITPSLQPTLLMSPYNTTYSATNNTVNLRNNAAFFGGISTSVNDINFTGTYVSNNILTYPTTLISAEYPILATMSYPPNYYDVSASTYVIVSPPATNYQPYLTFIGSTLYETYNQSSKIIDLSAKIQNLQGGMIGSTTVFSGIGVTNNILNYTGVNTYVVVATRRFTNYYDVSASIQIIITKATQPPGFVMTLPSTRYVRAASPGNTIALSSSGGLTGEPYTIVYSSNYGVISGSTLTYDAILYSNNVFIITAKKTSPNFEDAVASVSITIMRGGVDSFVTLTNSTNHTFQYSLNNTWSSTYANTGSLLTQMNQGIGGIDLNVTQNFIFGSNLTNPLKLQNKKTADLTGTSTVYSSTFTSYSDIRLKENIQTLKETEGVNNIRVVQYNNISDNTKHFGVIAHELQEVYPGLVHGEKEGNQMQSVSYSELIPICINEIKMLKDKKKRLKTAIESLEHKLSIKN